MYDQLPVNSPNLEVEEGKVYSAKQFSDNLTTDLTDYEITEALKIILDVKKKWERVIRSKIRHQDFTVEQAMKLLDQMEDELVTRLAEKLDLIATVDASPVFEMQPPIIDLVGALPSHSTAKYGFDHEQKQFEVKNSVAKGEAFDGITKLDE